MPHMFNLQRNTTDIDVVKEVAALAVKRRVKVFHQSWHADFAAILYAKVLASAEAMPIAVAESSSLSTLQTLPVFEQIGTCPGKVALNLLEVD
jgi:hypothetical protein